MKKRHPGNVCNDATAIYLPNFAKMDRCKIYKTKVYLLYFCIGVKILSLWGGEQFSRRHLKVKHWWEYFEGMEKITLYGVS